MPKKKASTLTDAPELSKAEIVRAATNDPNLSLTSFNLGDQSYQIVDLCYDDYLAFVSLLQPLIDQFVKGLANRQGIKLNGIELSAPSALTASGILTYCKESLPRMVQIICESTGKETSIEDIKKGAKTPFVLAEIVLKQVVHNGIIKDFASFFQSVLPLLKSAL